MWTSRIPLLWMGWVLLASPQAASESGLAVNLSNQTLRVIPNNIPPNITKLTLSYNLLTDADLAMLKNYTRLTELYLDNNIITALPGHIFDSLSELKILSVSYNNISRVEPKAFAGLARLTELDLSWNHIHSLPPGVFASLASLERLSLQANNLQSVENQAFTGLTKLKNVNLQNNPWNCSNAFLEVIKNAGVQIAQGAICANPKDQANRSIVDSIKSLSGLTTTEPQSNIKPSKVHTTSAGHHKMNNSLNKASPDASTDPPPVGNTWKFLVGVVITALSTSLLIVCAVKSPSWYKLLFNYRHQRLCEEDTSVFTTGRYSNFSLDTEQTETSVHELDAQLDDEDGFIEDRYIEPGDYKDVAED